MDESSLSVSARLAALATAYAGKLPARVAELAAGCEAIASGEATPVDVATAHRQAHFLAGSGATFGFAAVSSAARTLERLLIAIAEGEASGRDESDRSALASAVAELQCAAMEGGRPPSVHVAAPPRVSTVIDAERTLVLVEDDAELVAELSLQLGHYGYRVRALSDLADLEPTVQELRPAALLMDVMLPEGELAGVDEIGRLHRAGWSGPPVLFLSARSDMTARLGAVRVGASGYVCKPVDVGRLVDKLEAVTGRFERQPYRVLIVDDNDALAAHFALVLQEAGMSASYVTDPLRALDEILNTSPELVLIDLYMPSCSGLELAAVIRQVDALVGMPIVFLSTEDDVRRQRAAMHLGADDFLTKPIAAEVLLLAVGARVARARVLRSLMDTDSLTGLLNHTKFLESVQLSVEHARRRSGRLVVAMLDVDHFKRVNDSFGHPAGDRVLRVLGRMLKQRLRRTDVVGRYGGEEFAAILHDTGAVEAVELLDEIRRTFAVIEHEHPAGEFSVTFSAGVAVFPDVQDPVRLVEAADRALYEAKAAGRNRVVFAGPSGPGPSRGAGGRPAPPTAPPSSRPLEAAPDGRRERDGE